MCKSNIFYEKFKNKKSKEGKIAEEKKTKKTKNCLIMNNI